MDTHTEHDVLNYAKHEVIDDHGAKIGKVTDVISDDRTLEPRWMVVDLGMMRAAHYVPLEGAYHTENGQIVTPFHKDVVQDSPKVHGDHVLTPQDERDLMAYYGLAS